MGIIQMFLSVSDDLVDRDLLPRAMNYGAAQPAPRGFALDVRAYQRILQDYGIPSRWYPFDHLGVLVPALLNNRGVLAVGDAHSLYPDPRLEVGGNHAYVLTNYYTDHSERCIVGYVGLDSNFAQTEVFWPCQNVENAAQWAIQNFVETPVLITDVPVNWPDKAKYYKMTSTGHLTPAH